MTPEETKEFPAHLEAVAAILFKHRPREQWQDFESIERSVRNQLLEQVSPQIGNFFCAFVTQTNAGQKRQVQSCLGVLTVSPKQGDMGLKVRVPQSPWLEKSCLLLRANVS